MQNKPVDGKGINGEPEEGQHSVVQKISMQQENVTYQIVRHVGKGDSFKCIDREYGYKSADPTVEPLEHISDHIFCDPCAPCAGAGEVHDVTAMWTSTRRQGQVWLILV